MILTASRGLVVAGCVAIAFLMGGCSPTPAPTPGTGVSVSPTPPNTSPNPVTPSAPAPPAGPVPDSAFFTQPKERANNQAPDPFTNATKLGLPSLCGAAFPATVDRGRVHRFAYYAPGAGEGSVPDGTVEHSILVYQPGGAEGAMRRLRTAVAACPHDTRDGASLDSTITSTTGVGDERVLLQERWSRPGSTWAPAITYYSVVRIGGVITVLKVEGWEGIDADRGVTDTYTGLALAALRGWLG